MTFLPGLVNYNGLLYAFCKSRAFDNSLWYATFNGQTWSEPTPFDGKSSIGPAVTLFRNKLILAWKGPHLDQTVYWRQFDGRTWSDPWPQNPAIQSPQGPALCEFGGRLYAAWQGRYGTFHDPQTLLYASTDGTNWTEPQQFPIAPLPCAFSTHSPALAAYDGRLYVAYKHSHNGKEGQELYFSSSADGMSWTARQLIAGGRSTVGPALAPYAGCLYAAWKAGTETPQDQQLWWSAFDGQNWSTIAEISSGFSGVGPGLADYQDSLYAIYKGEQLFQLDPVRGPIRDADSLSYLTLTSPATTWSADIGLPDAARTSPDPLLTPMLALQSQSPPGAIGPVPVLTGRGFIPDSTVTVVSQRHVKGSPDTSTTQTVFTDGAGHFHERVAPAGNVWLDAQQLAVVATDVVTGTQVSAGPLTEATASTWSPAPYSVVDTLTASSIGAIAVDDNGTKVFVVSWPYSGEPGEVTTIDTTTKPYSVTTVGLPGAGSAAMTPDGTRLYINGTTDDGGGPLIRVLDTATGVVTPVVAGTAFLYAAFSRDGKKLFLTTFGTVQQKLAVLDTDPASPQYHQLVSSIDLNAVLPGAIAVSDWCVYVVNTNGALPDALVIYDLTTLAPLTTCSTDEGPFGVAVAVHSPNAATVYVSANNAGMIHLYDETRSATGQVTVKTGATTLTCGSSPQHVVASTDGKRVYIADPIDDTITVIDADPASASHNTAVATIVVGLNPQGLAISGNNDILCSANGTVGTVSMISVRPTC
jgi:YVTN family beta-propeller protein